MPWCATRPRGGAGATARGETVRGDVTDPASVAAAVEGCEIVFNAMGLPEQWLADETLFDRVNAEGTRTVARAAREAGVRRLVHTSTEDVFHAEPGGRFDETRSPNTPRARRTSARSSVPSSSRSRRATGSRS